MNYQLSKNEIEFLRGLRELTLKTGVAIYGWELGACLGTLHPSMINDEDGYASLPGGDKIEWVSSGDKYLWEQRSKEIIR